MSPINYAALTSARPSCRILEGDCVAVMAAMPEASVDAIVTDPPYGLEFMGKDWDSFGSSKARAGMSSPGIGERERPWPSFYGGLNPRCENCGHSQRGGSPCRCDAPRFPNERAQRGVAFQGWTHDWAREAFRVLKPGGHLLAFGGTRTFHRLACAIEDAGFEIRDTIAWMYGSGFPKSLDVSKALDKAARGVPQGGPDPTSSHHGQYRTTTTEGKRWDGDSGQGYGAGGSRFLATTVSGRTTAPITEPMSVPNAAAVDGPQRSTPAATASAERWQGWGTALKPAHEPIVVARKPLVGTVAANVLEHGTGALNVDGCRIGTDDDLNGGAYSGSKRRRDEYSSTDSVVGAVALSRLNRGIGEYEQPAGRWPANVMLDEGAAAMLDEQTGTLVSGKGNVRRESGSDRNGNTGAAYGAESRPAGSEMISYGDKGGASRFFYVAKASSAERNAGLDEFEEQFAPTMGNGIDGKEHDPETATPKRNVHPTVKPIDLMRWLCRLVTPPGGTVLDPFAGSGSTACAAVLEHVRFIGIEIEHEYVQIARARVAHWAAQS